MINDLLGYLSEDPTTATYVAMAGAAGLALTTAYCCLRSKPKTHTTASITIDGPRPEIRTATTGESNTGDAFAGVNLDEAKDSLRKRNTKT